MRALITGANGFVGTWLTRRLVERGDFVRCLVRSKSGGAEANLAAECVEGDVGDCSSLIKAVAGMDVVFHLAGIRRAPNRELFFRVNAEGTRNVCEAMKEAGARRLVLSGSLAASGPSPKNQPRIESDPFAPEEWYGESKAESERIAFSYSPALEVTCTRPPRISGPGDKENLVFFKLVNKGLKVVVGGGPRPLSTVDVNDVVDFLILLAERPEAVGQAFFVAGPDTTSVEGLQDEIARSLSVRPRPLYVPAAILRGLGAAADVASNLTGRHLPLNRKLARQLLATGWTCSSEKAHRLLGFQAQTSLRDSIQRSADWYRSHGWL